jgi:ComF family protein
MIRTIVRICTHFFDIILPPRRTERIVRALSNEALQSLATHSGTLPYHEPSITALVWELKYRKNSEALRLAGTFLAEGAMAIAEESLSKPVLVPVPMHHTRRKARGYNQTEALCEAILTAAPNMCAYAPNALVRVRNTIPQQGLPKHRRLKNMLGAIETRDSGEVAGKICIVVDDVSTTGATAHETKRALLEAGAKEVHILTLANS